MSHSINAYLWSGIEDELSTGSVAHLDYTISDRDRSFVFYRLIGAEHYDGGCSGIGKAALFHREVFEKALAIVAYHNATAELHLEVEFLTKCLNHERVYISFS